MIRAGFKTGAICHPERSEGSRVLAGQILRCAQNDNTFVIKGFETGSSVANALDLRCSNLCDLCASARALFSQVQNVPLVHSLPLRRHSHSRIQLTRTATPDVGT